MSGTGKLWVVATPIGNLDDLSSRAVAVLRGADLIACEDTRHSQTLLSRHSVDAQLVALHEHNERGAIDRLLIELAAGKAVALISDAGTPLISDPGFRLVRAARAAGIPVSPVPGACAAIAALSVAGLPSDRFVFEGFLPAKAVARRVRLRDLATETRTLIFYESAHRIGECIDDMLEIFGAERPAVIARELTKLFETVLDGDLAALRARLVADPNQQRGEFVVLVSGAAGADAASTALAEGRRVHAILREALPPGQAARLAAAISGAPRKALYDGKSDED